MTALKTDRALAALRSSKVFAGAPPLALQQLATFARFERFDTRTLLCASHQRCDALRYIVAGAAQISTGNAQGRVSALTPLVAGNWATWLGCFHDAPLAHDLWADAGTETIAFPRTKILACAEQNPAIYRGAIQEIGVRMRALMSWSLKFDQQDDVRALGRFILASCRAVGGTNDGPHVLTLTHAHLGEVGFGSRQRAGRLLNALQSRRLVSAHYGKVKVQSLRAIEAFLDAAP